MGEDYQRNRLSREGLRETEDGCVPHRFNVETKKSGERSERYCHGKRYATRALAEADVFGVRSGKETLKNRKKLSDVTIGGAHTETEAVHGPRPPLD